MTTKKEFLAYYRTLSDNELSRRIDLFTDQMQRAFDRRNDMAMQNITNALNAITQARLEKLK